ncbi:MOSC N-terminal beta barrel domain-containing protein [Gammaproteobacteria bacterium]|nr:MOSC N-terminal beta barrel domain-containing protein [Gammaproteobacteria bacterium]
MTASIRSLFIHPVKSCRASSLQQVNVATHGLENDRVLMAIDANGKFVTARKCPQLLQLSVDAEGDQFVLSHPQGGTLQLHVSEFDLHLQDIQVWKDQFKAYSTTSQADRWLSEALGMELKLLYIGKTLQRRLGEDDPLRPAITFADGDPIMLMGESSAQAINAQAGLAEGVGRYRANLIIGGIDAFVEEQWQRVRIGDVQLRFVKRCERCILTTRDPQTGQRHPDNQPLKTLVSERKNEQGLPCLGVDFIVEKTGVIRVGQELEVIERR